MRYQINSIKFDVVNGAFGLVTRVGTVWINPRSIQFFKRLKRYVPHIIEELIRMSPSTIEEFEDILVGRYLYGVIVKAEYKGIVYSKIL